MNDRRIKYYVHPPLLFRFMKKEHVEQFFTDGSLRLGSFRKFKNHTDEQRLDQTEGSIRLVTRSNIGEGQTIMATLFTGNDTYVLCTAGIFTNELMAAFGCDSYIRINNSHLFGIEIAKQIPGIIWGFECFCYYKEKKIWVKDNVDYDYKSALQPDGSHRIEPLAIHFRKSAGKMPFLIKHKEFSHQCEYRFVYITDSEAKEYLDIKVPEAIKYCSKPSTLDT